MHRKHDSPDVLNIVVVGPFPTDPVMIKGGVQASLYGLARTLNETPAIGSLLVLSVPIKADRSRSIRSQTVEGVPVTYLNIPWRWLSSIALHLPMIIRTLTSRKCVVHVHGTGVLQTSLCAWMRLNGVPFVWTLHGITEKETRDKLRERPSLAAFLRHLSYAAMERLCLSISDEIIVDTPYVREAIGRPDRPIHVIPQGIFRDEFAGMPEERSGALVLSIGALDSRKGHQLAIEAFTQVREQVPGARLIIAGALTDSLYFDSLRSQIQRLGLSESVEVLPNLPRGDLLALLRAAKVFALHSREESQGIAICEALAAGVPVVATNVGGIPFVVRDSIDGILVNYGDTHSFATALVRILQERDLTASLSASARARSARFDWKTVVDELITVYRAAHDRQRG